MSGQKMLRLYLSGFTPRRLATELAESATLVFALLCVVALVRVVYVAVQALQGRF